MTKETINNVPLGEFLRGDEEEWKHKWRDRKFTYPFPSNIQGFLSDDRHDQFLKEHGSTVITSAVSAFMHLPWHPRDKNSIALSNMSFTKEGKTGTFLDNKDNTQAADSLIKAEIASLMLLGFNPANQETTIQSLTSGFGELTASRKTNFRHNVFGIITKNSSVRAWIKTNNLDILNGFVWDCDVTKFALSLLPAINYKGGGLAVPSHLPQQLLSLEQFAPGTIEPFVDHMLDFMTSVSKITDRKKTMPFFNYTKRFMIEVNGYNGHNVPQEKLERLNNLLSEH